MANVYANLGIVEEMQGKLDGARELWRLSYELFTEIGAKPLMAQVSGWLADIDKAGN